MLKWYYNLMNFRFWFEENTNTFTIAGVILLVLGLIILVMRRAHILPLNLSDVKKKSLRLYTAGTEKGALPMTPGLREDRKITEYERKKRMISTLFSLLGLVAFVISAALFVLFLVMTRSKQGFITAMYLLILCVGFEIALSIAKTRLCIMCDHIIEMCYANQYRVMRDKPVVLASPAPTVTANETAEEQGSENQVGEQP